MAGKEGDELALERIRTRVEEGGHDIPEATVRRRFGRSLSNFLKVYQPLAGSWTVFDNSSDTPALIAFQESGALTIHDARKHAIVTERKDTV
jgi:predicted ABC-type ATPase